MNNCCENCKYADNYTGYYDFYCLQYKCVIRGEQINCEGFGFKEDDEELDD